MTGLDVLLFGVLLGLLVAILRPQTLVLPTVVPQPGTGGNIGCLVPLVIALVLLALLLGGKPT